MMKWLTAVFGMVSAVLYGLMQKRRVDASEDVREYEKAGSEAMVSGLKNEQEVRNEDVNTVDRNHFK